ncbi:MAG: hypothetical protein AAB074_12070 [Planctomycetota bacterium]
MAPAPPQSRLKAFVGCGIALLIFAGIPAAALSMFRRFEGSPTGAAEEFLEAMNRGDAGAARMACGPASGVPIEAALALEGPAWGAEWAVEERSRGEEGGKEVARVEARVKGRDGKTRTVEFRVSRFVDWRVDEMKIDGRSSFGPAELPAGMSMPEIRDVEVRKTGFGGSWDLEVTFTVSSLKTETRSDGKWASVVHAIVLRGPAGDEPYRMETTTEVREDPPGVHAFTHKLTVRPGGAGGRYVLHETITDRKSFLAAEKDIEITLP